MPGVVLRCCFLSGVAPEDFILRYYFCVASGFFREIYAKVSAKPLTSVPVVG
jgi:hypothetical protein